MGRQRGEHGIETAPRAEVTSWTVPKGQPPASGEGGLDTGPTALSPAFEREQTFGQQTHL